LEALADNASMMRVREGDLDSMGPLFERYKKPLFGFFYGFNREREPRRRYSLKRFLPKDKCKEKIFSVFDIKMIATNPVRKEDTKMGTYKVVIDKWVQGDVNGGGAEISMHNYNGNIIIHKKWRSLKSYSNRFKD